MMKIRILLGIFFIIIIAMVFIPKISTEDTFHLEEMEKEKYKLLADKNNTEAIYKLYTYYHYSSQEFDKATLILKKGAELGNIEFQYMYGVRLLRSHPASSSFTDDKEKIKMGKYWLNKAANSGYKLAIEKLEDFPNLRV